MPTAVPARPRANRLFFAGAGVLVVVLALCSIAASRYVFAAEWVEHSLQVERELDRWTSVMLELQSGTRAYVATGNRELLGARESLLLAERARAAELRRLLADNHRQAARVEQADRDAVTVLGYLERQIADVAAGQRGAALERINRGEGRDLLERFRGSVRHAQQAEEELLRQRRDAAASGARLMLSGALVLVATAAALLAFAWRRELRHDAIVTDMARSARGRLRLLSDLAGALAATRTVAQVAQVVVEHGQRAAGGDTCTLYALDPNAEKLALLGHHGVNLRLIEAISVISEKQGNPEMYRALRERRAVWVETAADYAQLYPSLAAAKVEGQRAQAFWSQPLVAEGQAVGLLGVGFYTERRFTPDERAFVDTLAKQCAQALLRAKRTEAKERHEARNEFLVRAGEALVASLDYESTLATLARLTVPHLADWCAINLVDGDAAQLKQVVVAHVDPDKARFAEELGRRFPPHADSGELRVIRTGKSELYAEITDELLAAASRDPEELRIARELELRSAIVVPLRARERIVGSMTFVYAGGERRYGSEDLVFAEELARRAAMAIENSMALKLAQEARDRERWLREEAERTNRLKDDFLATASHELRTPLNAILGWTLTLRRGNNSPETDRALGVVERNARAQAKLIEDVLDVSRIVSGKLVLTVRPTTVSAAARAAIETVTPAVEAKGIRLVADLEREPALISADPDRLQQVIWNLLSNSVKFTPKNGHITLSAYRDGPEVCISVDDDGEGIRPEILTAIFEPFKQADSSTTRRHGGLGLGLAIVRQLVEAHGGSVHASSEGPGKGSTFVVRLPVREEALSAGDEPRELPSAPAHRTRLAPATRLDRVRVLVVDDEHDARQLIHEILRDYGAQVTMVSSAAEARQALAADPADVIVSDVGMADEDGYSFISKLRAGGFQTPAVALTAYASPQDARRALEAGFQRHITKPVEPLVLVRVIAGLSHSEAPRGP